MFMFVAFGYFLYNCLQYFNLQLVSGPTYRIIISTKVTEQNHDHSGIC
jgi:hypothetical protein